MRNYIFSLLLVVFSATGFAQVTTLAPGQYKSIVVPFYSANLDYTRVLILLHESYGTTLLSANYAIGTITALRGSAGAYNRVNIAEVNTASAYNINSGSVSSVYNSGPHWKLKTCTFNGKKYLALEVPYADAYHDQGYKFTGWTTSTAENMLAVPYQINGNPLNQSVLSNIQDFVPTHTETHDVPNFNVTGSVAIGTTDPKGYKLAVAGNMIAESVKVKLQGTWPDFVFAKDYALPSLSETETHIKEKGHLPGIPSAAEVKENGIELGEMNKKLLEKIEELTLHLIRIDKENAKLGALVEKQQKDINELKTKNQ
ncbi:hypothetical protein [Pedobacter sp. JY14-1]|uniref:hypothetical protein n=1 Tax=Pedobacter sp. JY14-1 TaxID=3034151 RepID=UPI0023E303DE|nr:hypothetical protein [Pedobacter sp. JY14-1]